MIEIIGKYNSAIVYLEESQLDDELRSDIYNLCNNPSFKGDRSIRIMPDTHRGANGYPIGFTMKFKNRVDPRCVGVDIGCSVSSYKTNLFLDDVYDKLSEIDNTIKASVPMGANVHRNTSQDIKDGLLRCLTLNSNIVCNEEYISKLCKRIGMNELRFWESIGTLGGGNHFVELNIDSNKQIWFTIHCGSRNLGVKVCDYHTNVMLNYHKQDLDEALQMEINKIKTKFKGKDIQVEIERAKNLHKAYMSIKKEYLCDSGLQDYLNDMKLCQIYSMHNHFKIADSIRKVLKCSIDKFIFSMHNFIDIENKYIRKGAIPAYKDQLAIIPLNMRDGSIIVKGKGNSEWNESAPHGAGRVLSRSKAKQEIDMELYKLSMDGIYSTCINESTIDESPFAYKDKDLILKSIGDTVDVVEILKPILNIKAGE